MRTRMLKLPWLVSVVGGIFFFIVGFAGAATYAADEGIAFIVTMGACLAVGWFLATWILYFLIAWIVNGLQKTRLGDKR